MSLGLWTTTRILVSLEWSFGSVVQYSRSGVRLQLNPLVCYLAGLEKLLGSRRQAGNCSFSWAGSGLRLQDRVQVPGLLLWCWSRWGTVVICFLKGLMARDKSIKKMDSILKFTVERDEFRYKWWCDPRNTNLHWGRKHVKDIFLDCFMLSIS